MAETNETSNPIGRPLKFKTVDELDNAIQNYFAECDPHATKALVETGHDSKGNMLYDTRMVLTEQRPYTISGLARALGVSRQTLINYADREDFFDTVEAARNRCQEYAEQQLFEGNANGAKFSLNVNWGWTESKNVDLTSKGKPMPLLGGTTPLLEDDDADRTDDEPAEDSAA